MPTAIRHPHTPRPTPLRLLRVNISSPSFVVLDFVLVFYPVFLSSRFFFLSCCCRGTIFFPVLSVFFYFGMHLRFFLWLVQVFFLSFFFSFFGRVLLCPFVCRDEVPHDTITLDDKITWNEFRSRFPPKQGWGGAHKRKMVPLEIFRR